jgi:hypothetical protein
MKTRRAAYNRVDRNPRNGDERTVSSAIPEITSEGDSSVKVSGGRVERSAVSKEKWEISRSDMLKSETTLVSGILRKSAL